MPILAKEPSLFPENLLESPDFQQIKRECMVLYTKPRQEKSLARELLRREVSFYLPLVKKTMEYGHRRVVSFTPLFGGYVFMHGSESERLISLGTNRILRVLPVSDAEGFISDLRQ